MEKYLLINSKILPSVFQSIIEVKHYLADGTAQNISKAVKMAGISRSAFYKYKNYVFEYNGDTNSIITLSAVLSDKAGVFSALTAKLFELGINIITVNQASPVDGTAKVTMTVSTDNLKISIEELIKIIKKVSGIISVKSE